ncbi:7TM diverse intracellular signaling domain-containing protein [Pseudobacteriovorax antillogorgiicola]|uniref:7TM diverse intracellular signaling domain-containing protein n=1 Tax=Pseudobacteriovorax antillogorgiicola TaxID=1513793 RepID=UPI001FB65409|nr:7TM diverse intracellular signaling domain-containing protein [Pseudobacteriovorax antillogorgiicola]
MDIKPYTQFFIDESSALEFQELGEKEIPWADIEGEMYWGHLSHPLWLKVKVEAELEVELVLEHLFVHTDRMDVWHFRDNYLWHWQGGDRIGFKKSIPHARALSFLIPLIEGQQTIIIRIESEGNVSGRFDAWTYDEFSHHAMIEHIYIAALLGALIVTLLYNSFLYLSLKHREYLLYVGYLGFFFVVQCIFTGTLLNHMADSSLKFWLNNDGFHLCIFISLAFCVRFTIIFLNLKDKEPRLFRYLSFLFAALMGYGLISLALPYRFNSRVVFIVTVLASLSLLYSGFVASIRRYRPAYYYTLAWGFLLGGTLIVALKTGGVLPINLITSWSQLTGATIEAVLLSLALGERFNYMQRRASQQKEAYIRELVQKEESKRHSYEQLEKMVYPHQIERIKNGESLENTMPCEKRNAFVIAFDIINSTNLRHQNKREIFSEFFAHCHKIMMADYRKDQLQARAYRIKELGDGFLCSVGFPFCVPDGLNPGDVAFQLIQAFFHEFDQLMARNGLHGESLCSAAITFGEVEGFYPVSGVLEYDLFGRPVILASRYEAIRKRFFRNQLEGHILVVQTEAYQEFSQDIKQSLIRFDLSQGEKIRDHQEATSFYFKFIQPTQALRSIS